MYSAWKRLGEFDQTKGNLQSTLDAHDTTEKHKSGPISRCFLERFKANKILYLPLNKALYYYI